MLPEIDTHISATVDEIAEAAQTLSAIRAGEAAANEWIQRRRLRRSARIAEQNRNSE